MTLKELLKDSVTRSVQVGDKLHVVVASTVEEARKMCEQIRLRGLQAGNVVIYAGITEWRETTPLEKLGESGSGRYEWHADGNRVRCNVTHFTKLSNGETTRNVLHQCWKPFDVAVE
jgi:hypothetical protein